MDSNVGVELFAGRYRLLEPIADGGMGSIWRAWDAKHQRHVAVKMLRPQDASSLLRFVREQSLRIEHPHVLAPLSWAAEDEKVLLTMDLVRGGNLSHLIRDYGHLPPAYVAILVDQLLDALDAVHARDVVHRDVKPGNILMEPTGRAAPFLKLSDFGIAGVMGQARLTQPLSAVGTLGYIAPESALGADPDPRQDLYSVGVLGLRLLTGIEAVEVAERVREDASLSLPPRMRAALLQAASIRVERRPETARDLRERWRQACISDEIGEIDSHSPDAIEVFEHLREGESGKSTLPNSHDAAMSLAPPHPAVQPSMQLTAAQKLGLAAAVLAIVAGAALLLILLLQS